MLLARKPELDEEIVVARERRIDVHDALEADAWQALCRDVAECNAFAEPWFVQPALRHLRGTEHVWQLEAHSAQQLIGVMHVSIQHRYGRMPVRHIGNWAHYQCFMGTPLVREGYEERFWLAILRSLDAAPWAPNFLSVSGLDEDGPVYHGLIGAGRSLNREVALVHRFERALLASSLSADAYLEASVRGKKRKELRRLANRLADVGAVLFRQLTDPSELPAWVEAFLTLEGAGWKGRDGAALGREDGTSAFFRDMMQSAQSAGRLDFQRLDLDGRPLAMLVNFRTPPGSWSFKIAFDETFARFSPGVMIELENLRIVQDAPDIDWMDSCAVEGHPMIDRLWMERRRIVQVTVPLSGAKRRLIHATCRAAERASAFARSRLSRPQALESPHG